MTDSRLPEVPPLPKLEYPTLYTFRAIGRHGAGLRERVRLHVQSIVGPVSDDSISERPSRAGAYLAIHVRCILHSEEQRRAVYSRLHGDSQLVLVL